ncbi:petidase, M16 family, putative [Plasmodium malariae]|uniref:Petidase, M16 family, putative n=1 Tax=Plasmodium malariae TaxID=5858 RepID=A0A1C3KCM5_PLAMA|nr:petidase, M16 family, putative [Plasmodium malariae]
MKEIKGYLAIKIFLLLVFVFANNINTVNNNVLNNYKENNTNKANYLNDSLSTYNLGNDDNNTNNINDNTNIISSIGSSNNNERQNLTLNESKNNNNYLQKWGDTNLESPKLLKKDVNIKNHEMQLNSAKTLESKELNNEKTKITKGENEGDTRSNEFKNFMNAGLDKKSEKLFVEDEIKNYKYPEHKNVNVSLNNVGKNGSTKKMPFLENFNNYKDESNQKIKYIDDAPNSGNNKEIKEKNNVNLRKKEELEQQNNMSYSIENTNIQLNNSRKDKLKKINPVNFGENTSSKLNDTSEEDENDIFNEIKNNEENIFSEKITLKKGAKDRNEYKYFKLKSNELKVLGIINKYSPKGGFSISIECGGYDDFDEIPGISNLLQHVIFYKSEKRNTTLLSELGKYSSEHNSHTSESFTNYYAVAHSEDIYHLLNLFAENLFFPLFYEEDIQNEVNEINNNYVSMENNSEGCLKIVSQYVTEFKYSKFFTYGNYITLCENVLNNKLNIKKILKEFHKKCYQPKNMSLSILLGKKGNFIDHYNMNDIENMVVEIFGKLKNYNYASNRNVEEKKYYNYLELEKKKLNRHEDIYNGRNFFFSGIQNKLIGETTNETAMFIQFIDEFNFTLDLNQKSKYTEILKKDGWGDQMYLYWSSKINIELYKKIEEFGTMIFLRELFSDFRKNGLYYKLSVENKYAYDFKIVDTWNKYYLNYGVLINLTEKGKSNLAHLIHIFNVFINQISKLFDKDSLDKGINKYILDYYREKALNTDLNFNIDNKSVNLNDLIKYSNKLLVYSGDDVSSLLTINNLIEDKYKNDFRNHIKITSLIGSLLKNENLHIINIVDTFSITNTGKIPNTTIMYATGDNPYLVGEEGIINDISITLPEIKVCPFSSFGNNSTSNGNGNSNGDSNSNNILYEQDKSLFCVPYNNRENFEYSEKEEMFESEENKNVFKSNILYNIPCLIKSSYGYNIYFKRGLTDTSKVKADFIFYFPSKNFTLYEAIFTRIHAIILRKKIKILLADYINCSVHINIKENVDSYVIHVDTYSYYFEELLTKLEDLLSVKDIPSKDEFNDAYDVLNLYVKINAKFKIENSLNVMYSLFNKYIPTNKETYDILNAHFYYPSYNAYTNYLNNFFHRNYISIFIYGNVIIPNAMYVENSLNGNNIISSNGNNLNSISGSNIHEHILSDTIYDKISNKDNATYLKKQDKFGEGGQYQFDSLHISHNGSGIEYLIVLCESFIGKVTSKIIKINESTYYKSKLINNEDIDIHMQNPYQSGNTSITVSYLIESETILSNLLINIISDLISSDFIKFAKIRYNDGYTADVKTFFTHNGLGGLLFIIQSYDNKIEKMEADICTIVKFLTFQLLNMDLSDLVKKLEDMKERYIINNTIFTFNEEYSSILEQFTGIEKECFDKKYKIIKIFDELIKCPKIILNKINYILKNAKKVIFKDYKVDVNVSHINDGVGKGNFSHQSCNYSYSNNNIKMSNVQLTEHSRLIIEKKLNENKLNESKLNESKLNERNLNERNLKDRKLDSSFRMKKLPIKENFINVSNFLQMKKKGFFQYIIDYFRSNNGTHFKNNNYLDFKSCDEEMSKDNFLVFQNFTDDINKIREHFLLKFANDAEIKENCSVDYEEVRQYCYAHNNNYDKKNVKN